MLALSGTGGGSAIEVGTILAPGGIDGAFGLGYGTGPYGGGTYGTPRAVSGLFQAPRTWALDNWGEDLVANPRNGNIYWWDRTNGTGNPRAAIK